MRDYLKPTRTKAHQCNRCGFHWTGRVWRRPYSCPKCKSPYWDRERIRHATAQKIPDVLVPAVTHDYTAKREGVDYSFSPNGKGTATMQGSGAGVRVGDYFIMRHPAGGTTRYRVKALAYHDSISWDAAVVFAPRPKA